MMASRNPNPHLPASGQGSKATPKIDISNLPLTASGPDSKAAPKTDISSLPLTASGPDSKATPKTDISSLPLPAFWKERYSHYGQLAPIQEKALKAGLLEGRSLLVCAPTASGKTLVATMAIVNCLTGEGAGSSKAAADKVADEVVSGKGKAVYLSPLKALAREKYKEYRELLQGTPYKVIISTGDMEEESPHLANYDLLILTNEKMDSLLRHRMPWLSKIKVVIADEIHLLQDPNRGPRLEIVLTLLKQLLRPQIIGLSATIGNPQDLAGWLEAELVQDNWRPVELKQGIRLEGKTEFY